MDKIIRTEKENREAEKMNRTQAMEFDGQIRKHLEEYSLQNGLNPTFGNTIMDKYLEIIPDTAKREMIFLGDKSASYKLGISGLILRVDL